MRRHQQGMTFIGILCILAMAGVIGYAGIRLAPLFLNYLKVSRALDGTASEVKGETPDPGAIRRALEKHWEIDMISGVEAKEVEVEKDENGGFVLHIAYDDTAPFIANVSLDVHFDKTAKVQ